MNVTLNANVGWAGADFELEAGKIDRTARWVFTRGQCHSLALAIHEATGWDVVGTAYDWDTTPGHVGVLSPHGYVFDIDGRWTREAWDRFYGGCELVDADDAYGAFDGDYREPEVEAAREWVEPVLASTRHTRPLRAVPRDARYADEEDAYAW